MTRVTVERTLARVDDDLRQGDIAMARTRLKSLLQSLPQSLDARERLAEVCRLDGDRREVRARAEAAAGKKLDWSDRGSDVGGRSWGGIGCSIAVLALVALVVIGVVTVVGWIF